MANDDELRVYHAFRSPYSRLGLHILSRAGLTPRLLAFTGPPEGAPFSDPMANKAKMKYYALDSPRMAMRMGLPMTRPKPFDVDFSAANAALAAAQIDGLGLAYAIAVSDARWGRGEDVSDMTILKAAAEAIDWDPARVETAAHDDVVAEQLRADRAQLEIDEVFGVPFAVLEPAKFWGHDRFDLLVEEINK